MYVCKSSPHSSGPLNILILYKFQEIKQTLSPFPLSLSGNHFIPPHIDTLNVLNTKKTKRRQRQKMAKNGNHIKNTLYPEIKAIFK